jgi:subtilase family serine protease
VASSRESRVARDERHGCTFGPHHAVVDAMDQVVESNENNNTADIDVIC